MASEPSLEMEVWEGVVSFGASVIGGCVVRGWFDWRRGRIPESECLLSKHR